jgi:hypothetical protein
MICYHFSKIVKKHFFTKSVFYTTVNIFQYSGKIFEYVKIILCAHKEYVVP